jgi:hypothetical protein
MMQPAFSEAGIVFTSQVQSLKELLAANCARSGAGLLSRRELAWGQHLVDDAMHARNTANTFNEPTFVAIVQNCTDERDRPGTRRCLNRHRQVTLARTQRQSHT